MEIKIYPRLSTDKIEKKIKNEAFISHCSFSDYTKVNAMNQSYMKDIVINPKRLSIKKETPAMALGRAYHEMVLEPEEFDTNFVVIEGDARTKAFKEEAKRWHTHQIIKEREFKQMKTMYENLLLNNKARELLEQCTVFETSIFWIDKELGFECKGRVDALILNENNEVTLVDLKTTKNAYDFKKSAYVYSYDLQAAYYIEGLTAVGYKVRDVKFLVSEKEETMDTIVWTATDKFLSDGQKKLDYYKTKLVEVMNTGRDSYEEELFL
jgi:hypothetical protein